MDAHDRATQHLRAWGAVGYETSQSLAIAPPEEVFDFMVWFAPEIGAQDRLELARRVDSRASAGEVAPVVFVRATASSIREFAMSGAVSKVVLAGRTSALRAAEVYLPRASNQLYPLPNSALNQRSNEVFTVLGYDGTGERVGLVEARGQAASGCLVASTHESLANATFAYQRSGIPCSVDADCFACEEQFLIDDTGTPVVANGRCVDFGAQNYCVSEHASMVASRIASRHRCNSRVDEGAFSDAYPGEPSYWFTSGALDFVCVEGDYNAAGANVYVTNNFSGYAGLPSGSSTAEIEAAYAYLSTVDGGTPLVNESYGAATFREPSAHAVLADWFARYRNMLFVQAAGNGEPSSSDLRTFCLSFNGLCVGATEVLPRGYLGPMPVEPDLTDLTYAFFSLWQNYSFESTPLFELEKPDLVSDGHWSHVMDLSRGGDMTYWKLAHGTSFSAPAVTGILAQLRHSCRDTPQEADFDETYELRAAVMFSQWDSTMYRLETSKANPEIANGTWPEVCPSSLFGTEPGPVYPTADGRLGCDYKAGVGQLDARRLARLCRKADSPWPDPEAPDDVGSTSGTIPPQGGTPVPAGLFDPEDGLRYLDNRSWPGHTPTGPGAPPPPVPGGASTRSGAGTNLTMETLTTLSPPGDRVELGTRIRASFAYMSCPGGSPAFDQSVVRWSDIGGGHALPAQPPPIGDLQPAVDFNIALVGILSDDTEALVYASEALYDTEEGFDVVVPHAGFKKLEIRVIKPDSYVGCGGQPEPFALSHGVWWAPVP